MFVTIVFVKGCAQSGDPIGNKYTFGIILAIDCDIKVVDDVKLSVIPYLTLNNAQYVILIFEIYFTSYSFSILCSRYIEIDE